MKCVQIKIFIQTCFYRQVGVLIILIRLTDTSCFKIWLDVYTPPCFLSLHLSMHIYSICPQITGCLAHRTDHYWFRWPLLSLPGTSDLLIRSGLWSVWPFSGLVMCHMKKWKQDRGWRAHVDRYESVFDIIIKYCKYAVQCICVYMYVPCWS